MTQALIVRDRFDNEQIAEDMNKYIRENGIQNVVEINSLNRLEEAKMLLDQKEPCLFLPNIFIRYNVNLKYILNFHKDNKFSTLMLNNRIVSFYPGKINKQEPTNNSLSYIEDNMYGRFSIQNLVTDYKISEEKPIIFIYSHNRDIYLQLTLNSLDFSLIQKIPIKILLNKPTEKVKQVALNFAKGKDYVEVLESNENTFITATNILIQYFRPEKFILMEDDFIFPKTTKEYLPNWPFQFLDRLRHFDVVAWSASLDNVHAEYFSLPRWPNVPQCMSDWELIHKGSKTLMMAQALAVKTDFYIKSAKADNNKYMCNFDSTLHSPKKCTPALRGYHIGFNQQMDGYPSINEIRWPDPIEICTVTSLTTGMSKEIKPKDLYNMI